MAVKSNLPGLPEEEKKVEQAVSGNVDNNVTDSLINASTTDDYDKAISDIIEASKAEADEEARLQQESYELSVDKAEQEKESAYQDYLTEQKAAHVDYEKQTDKYGVNAEKMASSGLKRTGYSETVQASFYNSYQQRVAAARTAYKKAELDYQNGMREAKLSNDVALAKIRSEAFAKQLELTFMALEYRNQGGYASISGNSSGGVGITAGAGAGTANGSSILSTYEPNSSNGTSFVAQGGNATAQDAVKYGTFSNGYQPKGISGHGYLSKTGSTRTMSGSMTKSGKDQDQNIWAAEDGTFWVWNGKLEKYEQIYAQ